MQVNLPKVKLQYLQELQEALTSMGENNSFTKTEGMSIRNNIGIVVAPPI